MCCGRSSCCRPSPFSVVRPARYRPAGSRARIARRPSQVADTLETEHRIVSKRNHREAAVGVAGCSRNPVGHRARPIILSARFDRQRILYRTSVGLCLEWVYCWPSIPNTVLAEHTFLRRKYGFRRDRYDAFADFLFFWCQSGQDADECHRGQNSRSPLDLSSARMLTARAPRLLRRFALRQVAAQSIAACVQVFVFFRIGQSQVLQIAAWFGRYVTGMSAGSGLFHQDDSVGWLVGNGSTCANARNTVNFNAGRQDDGRFNVARVAA